MLARADGASGGRHSLGSITVEFALVLTSSFALFAFVVELLRLSFIDQTLAWITHRSARAVATMPTDTGCEAVVKNTFQSVHHVVWLFDDNGDGEIAGVAVRNGWPAPGVEEVQVAITWDESPYDGVDDGLTGSCGDTGSWLKVRSAISVQPWFPPFRPLAPNGLPLRHESWGRADRA